MHNCTFNRLSSLALATLLVGCAAKEVPFDAANGPPVKTIGLLTPAMPSGPSVVLASSVGKTAAENLGILGIVPALIDQGMQNARENKLQAVLATEHFDATQTLLNDLKASLEAEKYTVVLIPADRKKSDFLKPYPTPSSPIDAYLDIVIESYGFGAVGISSSQPYRPEIMLKCKLVRADGATLLMQDAVIYNPLGKPDAVVTIPPDPAFAFADDDKLNAVPAKTKAALDTAIAETSRSVAGLLR
jgi:hypothetical protein